MRLSPTLLVALSCTAFAVACVPKTGDSTSSSSSSVAVLDEKQTAAAVLDALMEEDMDALAGHMDQKKGTRFTASTYVRTQTDAYGTPADRILYADTIADMFTSAESKVWGIEDGSGEPIDLTVAQYFDKYVKDQDYRKAPETRWNHAQDRGNTIDNAATVYPGAQIVEYHFPGFDPQYGGMDWVSLRLVLQQDGAKKWNLVGVIHDHWTP